MKTLRRSIFVLALTLILVSVILLLNFTAPNPTGRRYSSDMPLIGEEYTPQEKGESGERIMSADLGLPRNSLPNRQAQCICNIEGTPPSPSTCTCMSYEQLITNSYRQPDFVSSNFIADSKNKLTLSRGSNRDSDQSELGDYAIGAIALGIPLYVFTRMDTEVAPAFYDLVESTGGAIVPYFTVPGYVDPVDTAATVMLLAGVALLVVLLLWAWLPGRIHALRSRPKRPPSKPSSPIDDLGDFMQKSKDRARRQIDTEDARPL